MANSILTSIGLLVLRVSFGCMMAIGHGWPKLEGFSEKAATFADPLQIGSRLSLISAIGAELGCSILLVVGLLSRIAAIPLAFTMGVALFVIHGDDPWADRELAAVYLAAFSALILTGPGSLSLDHWVWRRRKSKS